MSADAIPSTLTAIPNVGPAVARKLLALDIHGLDDLRGRDPEDLFERLCAQDGRRHDPCLLDTFTAAVAYADGGPPRPWWEFSRERKAREATTRARAA
jgi:Pathogenicity locus